MKKFVLPERVRRLITNFKDISVAEYKRFENVLEDATRTIEAQTRIAELSNYDVAKALNDVVRQIACCRAAPEAETYISLMGDASELLAMGADPAEVLWAFDRLLEKEKWVAKHDN